MSGLPGYDSGASLRLHSPLVELADARLDEHHVRLLLKRDDLIHPELPGNKWRKLSHNLATAREQGYGDAADLRWCLQSRQRASRDDQVDGRAGPSAR